MSCRETLQNRSPGNLDDVLEPVPVDAAAPAIERAVSAARTWAETALDERIAALSRARDALQAASGELALLIAREVGKPLAEARGELAAVIAKFAWSFRDAEEFLRDTPVTDGPHPAAVRRRALGPAAVIAPFNFPLHLGHGATVAYLLVGNPVLFKPSPFAPLTARRYGEIFASFLPEGVLQIVQGGAEVSQALALDERVRALCFTGSIPVGQSLAKSLAHDFSKILCLELGGKNSAIVFADAEVSTAAHSCAEAMCLTTGQRCNATNRILVETAVEAEFTAHFLQALREFRPGNPLLESTRMGPLVSQAAVGRMKRFCENPPGQWLLEPEFPGTADGLRGHYVTPGVLRCTEHNRFFAGIWAQEEAFAPLVTIEPFVRMDDAWAMANNVPHGLTASVFTTSAATWHAALASLEVGNLYRNLPTTFSPSSLPFGGWKASGNGRPGARGFVRHAMREQSVQWLEQ